MRRDCTQVGSSRPSLGRGHRAGFFVADQAALFYQPDKIGGAASQKWVPCCGLNGGVFGGYLALKGLKADHQDRTCPTALLIGAVRSSWRSGRLMNPR